MAHRAMALRIANYLMLLVFLLAAAVQYNDPDPARWIAMYGAAAGACGLYLTSRFHWSVAALVGLVALAWAATLVPRVIGVISFTELFDSMQMKTTGIEEGRELGGLLIIAGWMVTLTVASCWGGRSVRPNNLAQPAQSKVQ